MSAPRIQLTETYAQAVAYAATVHANQTRKGTDTPYICHLLGVSSLVLEAGGDEVQAIAGLLHDAPEDHGGQARLDEIRELFGPGVADIVELCSDSLTEDPTKKEDYWPRKEHHLARLEAADPYPLLVALADKVHNCRAIATDLTRYGPDYLERFNGKPDQILEYYGRNYRIGVDRGLPQALLVPLDVAIQTLTLYVDGPRRIVRGDEQYEPLPPDKEDS